MKFKFVRYIVLSGMILGGLASCDDEYLETAPEASASPETVFETTENARYAINGLARIMTSQHLGSQGFNGEGTIKMYYGNYPGNNFSKDLAGWSNVINGGYIDNDSSKYGYYPWHYYQLIGNANQIIASIDDAEGPDSEKAFIKAQALTYRAYSYLMLSQIYGDRWKDSDNGSTSAVVIRTKPDLDNVDIPLSTLQEVYDQVYKDLDEAISLFKSTEYSRDKNYEMDQNVAEAVYARAALIKEDYELAAEYAAKAREGYPLMSNSAYQAGFYEPTSEWIWSSFDSAEETLYFYSYQAYIAYNSTASIVRLYPTMMSKELYEKIPKSDLRRDLFLNPENYDYSKTNGQAGDKLDAIARGRFPKIQSNALTSAYMNLKIGAEGMPGIGQVNHFRSSEMVLIEAEANYFLKNEDKSRNLLEELTRETGRDPSYSATESGEALFNEIKKYRGIELWGEGFDWFDMKRWKDPIDRKSFNEGGNFLNSLAVRIEPSQNNNWKWRIPEKEKDHNDAVK